jgi:hypothetical protein
VRKGGGELVKDGFLFSSKTEIIILLQYLFICDSFTVHKLLEIYTQEILRYVFSVSLAGSHVAAPYRAWSLVF